MNHIYNILFFFLLASNNSYGQQNLILNGDFEEYWECPTNLTEIEKCKYVYNPCVSAPPPQWSSTSDYFNSCSNQFDCNVPLNAFGYQQPHSGNGYIGLICCQTLGNYKEYIQLSFSIELTAFSVYEFSIYVNLTNNGGYTSKHLGFVFNNSIVNYNNYVSEFIQPDISLDTLNIIDTLVWNKISFNYTAKGGERYIMFGNFHTNSSNDCVFNNEAPLNSGQTYFVFDDAQLKFLNEMPSIVLPNVFTPNNDGINDTFKIIQGGDQIEMVEIFNRWGELIYSSQNVTNDWNGKSIRGEELLEGVYFYKVTPKIFREDRKEQYQGMVHLKR